MMGYAAADAPHVDEVRMESLIASEIKVFHCLERLQCRECVCLRVFASVTGGDAGA